MECLLVCWFVCVGLGMEERADRCECEIEEVAKNGNGYESRNALNESLNHSVIRIIASNVSLQLFDMNHRWTHERIY